ncbi:ATP/GTP-binding protein [Streptomyces sp. NPDC050145]|uniref:ATP/GTP-binding protein n=1 Tax=Streptomyces sp. NPDC050145 TaxID=3365602 RepID=UPI0037BB594A
MDTPAPGHLMNPLALPGLYDVVLGLGHAAEWLLGHWYLALILILAAWMAWEAVVRRLAQRASLERCTLTMTPAPYFDPDAEHILRQGITLLHAANALPWWAPKRCRAVRIRMRSDEHHPLAYQLEGPAPAAKYLRTSPYGEAVTIAPPDPKAPPADDRRDFVVRGELILRGNPVTGLREVPLSPDPLQPIVDAVSALKTDLGDLVEICVDVQSAPRLPLRLQQTRMLQRRRSQEQREAAAALHHTQREAAAGLDSLRAVVGGQQHQAPQVVVPSARRIDRDDALGRLATGTDLARVQILIRCASDDEGRARALLAQTSAAFKVFGHDARWAPRGLRLLGWFWGADRWPFLKRWEQRWASGQCAPGHTNLANLTELAGLLKPPTAHCRLPLLAAQLPTFDVEHIDELVLQGSVLEADGSRRMVATREEETVFEIGLGKTGAGKTERALAQAIMVAHAGGGLLYVDPHRDSWDRAARYLAHPDIIKRIQVIDLNPAGDSQPVGAWNLLDMSRGRARHTVVASVVDGLSAGMNWDDSSAPRALTILTACVQVLAAVNERACDAKKPRAQATIFHIRALLTDPDFRREALTAVRDLLSEDTAAWWDTVFPTLSVDAFGILLNPLARLADNPTYHAFLGQPISRFDLRAAMDRRRIIWVCTAGNGPTDRLVSSLIAHELLRAGRSRRDTPRDQRAPFRAYLDELITIAGTAPDAVAAMFEDLRKSGVRVHGMSQSLTRLPQAVRDALLQNSSTLSTTTGSRKVISVMTEEWGERPSADQVAALPHYQHYARFTIGGRHVGPVRIHGIHLDDDLKALARPRKDVADLVAAAHKASGGAPLEKQVKHAAGQLRRVRTQLKSTSLAKPASSASGGASAGQTGRFL